jgi:hypothetical protein
MQKAMRAASVDVRPRGNVEQLRRFNNSHVKSPREASRARQ